MESVFEFDLTNEIRGKLIIVAQEGPTFDIAADAREQAAQLLYARHGYDIEEATDIIENADWRICGTPRPNVETDHQALEMELDIRQTMPYEPETTTKGELDGLADIDDWDM